MENERELPVREFGNAMSVSFGFEPNPKILEDVLIGGALGIKNMLANLPDATIISPLTFNKGPTVDRLNRFKIHNVSVSLTSSMFEFWSSYAQDQSAKAVRQSKEDLRRQSQKSWFTKLCWKLGGFNVYGA